MGYNRKLSGFSKSNLNLLNLFAWQKQGLSLKSGGPMIKKPESEINLSNVSVFFLNHWNVAQSKKDVLEKDELR